MSSGFEEFTEAVAKTTTKAVDVSKPDLARVAVLGCGADARLLAALCLSEGADVTLFSAYGAELTAIRASGGISLRGAGPVGTYQVDQDGIPSVKTTAELDSAVTDADLIFLTGPVHKQRTYAMVLADHLSDGQVIVLAPGRSLGALETAWFLRIGGCKSDVTLVETQGLPYWISERGAQLTLGTAGSVAAATLPSGRNNVLTSLAKYLPNITPCASVLESGFADGSACVEVPALLLGGPALPNGSINIPIGGVALQENESFAALLGSEHHDIIAKLCAERCTVARAFGVRNMPDAGTTTTTHGGALKGDGRRPVPDYDTARGLLRDGVIGSLVPLVSAAEIAGVATPVTTAMITLASSVLGADVAAAGRRLGTIGIDARDIDTARRAMDAIALGAG